MMAVLEARRGPDGCAHRGWRPSRPVPVALYLTGADILFDGGHAFFVQDPTAWPMIVGWLSRTVVQ